MSKTDASESVTRRGFMRTATGAAAAAAASATAAAQEETTEGEGEGEGEDGGGGGGGGTEEVVVGPGNELVFEPADLTIAPGTTVLWTWDSDNHNVVAESVPDEADWEGTEGGDDETYDTGYEYEYTFEVEGDYSYYCTPHQQAGMEASITVQEGGGGGEAAAPSIPNSAKTLGIATTAALVFTLGLAYFFMKYGGDYGEMSE